MEYILFKFDKDHPTCLENCIKCGNLLKGRNCYWHSDTCDAPSICDIVNGIIDREQRIMGEICIAIPVKMYEDSGINIERFQGWNGISWYNEKTKAVETFGVRPFKKLRLIRMEGE